MFLILVCLSSFFPQYDKATFLASHAVFYGMIWYYGVYKTGNKEYILNTLCVIALINIGFLVLQSFGIALIFNHNGDTTCVGLMANPNEISAVLALCFPAFLRKKWNLFIPIVLLGLVLSSSFGGFIAVIVGSIYYLWKRINKVIIILGITATVILFMFFDTPGISYRLATWIVGLKLYLEHPIIGSGIGHWKYVFSNISVNGMETRMLQAHNEYLQGMFEMGLPFLVILGGFLVTMWHRLKKLDDIYKVAMIVILINCFVNFPLHIAVTAYMILTWIAIIDKGYHNEKD